jgi:transposase InsO family protein
LYFISNSTYVYVTALVNTYIFKHKLALVTVDELIDTDTDTDDDSTGTQVMILNAQTTNTTEHNTGTSNSTTTNTVTKKKTLTAAELHSLYGHVNLSRAALDKLGCSDAVYDAASCSTCAAVRIRKKKTGSGTYIDPYAAPLLRLDVDLQGPITDVDALGRIVVVKSIGGAKYILNVICHYSRFTFTVPLVTKSAAAQHIINIVNYIRTQHGIAVRCVHSDNGGEFTSSKLKDFYAANGIIHSLSPAYASSTNGTVERCNQTILLMVKSMLNSAGAPSFLWGEAAVQAAKIHNAVPLKSLNFKSPHELVTGKLAHVPAVTFGSGCLWKPEAHTLG